MPFISRKIFVYFQSQVYLHYPKINCQTCHVYIIYVLLSKEFFFFLHMHIENYFNFVFLISHCSTAVGVPVSLPPSMSEGPSKCSISLYFVLMLVKSPLALFRTSQFRVLAIKFFIFSFCNKVSFFVFSYKFPHVVFSSSMIHYFLCSYI